MHPALPVAGSAEPRLVAAGRSGWDMTDDGPLDGPFESYHEDVAHQVRIEQHLQIRIVPHAGPVPMDVEFEESRTVSNPRYVTTKVGKCIASGNFTSVSP